MHQMTKKTEMRTLASAEVDAISGGKILAYMPIPLTGLALVLSDIHGAYVVPRDL